METGNQDRRQRSIMIVSLGLLVLALTVVLWRNADFWFADTPAVESLPPNHPAATPTDVRSRRAKSRTSSTQNHAAQNPIAQNQIAQDSGARDQPSVSIGQRMVLPPMEIEVIASNSHRTIHPGSRSLPVEMTPAAPTTVSGAATNHENATAAAVTTEAAERVHMSENAAQLVAEPVRPSYPLLARQMKVQGSVVLQALIGKDGVIQHLRVLTGPGILASAAQDAVRQWRFKPQFEGNQAVETETQITVNFTISTN